LVTNVQRENVWFIAEKFLLQERPDTPTIVVRESSVNDFDFGGTLAFLKKPLELKRIGTYVGVAKAERR